MRARKDGGIVVRVLEMQDCIVSRNLCWTSLASSWGPTGQSAQRTRLPGKSGASLKAWQGGCWNEDRGALVRAPISCVVVPGVG